jgi:hypothetical protein
MRQIRYLKINAKLYAGGAAGCEIVRDQRKCHNHWSDIIKLPG